MKYLLTIVPLFIPLVFAEYQVPEKCGGKVRIRAEWRDLLSNQKQAFRNAMECIYNDGNYEDFALLHRNSSKTWHNGPLFLFAHRALLIDWEDSLRSCYIKKYGNDDDLILPYWDWTLDYQDAPSSEIWTDFGFPEASGCIQGSTEFSSWKLENACISRGFDYKTGEFDVPNPYAVAKLIQQENDFLQFTDNLELGPHASIHIGIGGLMSMVETSARDPVFWIHHLMVDKLFSDWQNVDPENRLKQVGGVQNGVTLTPEYRIPGLPYQISDIVNSLDNCYVYVNPKTYLGQTTIDENTTPTMTQSSVASRTPTPVLAQNTTVTNGTQIVNSTTIGVNNTISNRYEFIVYPNPIPDEFCIMMGYDIAKVRNCEKIMMSYYQDVEQELKQGKKCFGPGVIDPPSNYTGNSPYPPVTIPVKNCSLEVSNITMIVPSYGKTTGYAYGDNGYIDPTSVASAALETIKASAALIATSFLITQYMF